jgi:hypothetical protein
MNALADAYIAAKENGLSVVQVGILATQKGIQTTYGHTLVEGDIYPYDWENRRPYPGDQEAMKNQMPASILEKAAEIKSKLQGNLGLGDDFISYLFNPRIGLRGASDESLDFLSRLIDIHNQHKPDA